MMDMPMAMPEEKLRKLTGERETRGMRRDWYTGVEGLMTVVPGASTPGGGDSTPHRHRN